MDIALAHRWISAIADAIAENTDYLTQLDSAIGDADHGVNMHRGFVAVVAALDAYDAETVGDVFVRTGTTLVSKVGGASGPLYGSAFRAIGKALPAPEISPKDLAAALQAGLDAVRKLGAAAPGDKTMVDAYVPAVDAFTGAAKGDADLATAAGKAADAAAEGMRSTIDMQARKGRASYLGPRSIGHQDPGATSTAIVFRCLVEVATGSKP
jgi:phosphoenolpyruvate---glycerone phosphotransferase subunit DhaL